MVRQAGNGRRMETVVSVAEGKKVLPGKTRVFPSITRFRSGNMVPFFRPFADGEA